MVGTTGSLEYLTAPDGTRLGLHVLGSGSPVVCVPGGPGRASVYLEDLAGLAEHHTLLRLDQRGTGTSELPADRDSLAFPRLADDLEALRLVRGLDSFDLLGHSAGCFVSLTYAARNPERVSRLVLVTPSGRGFGDVDGDVKAIRASRAGEPWYDEAVRVEAELELLPPERRQRPNRETRPFGYGRWDDRAQEHAGATESQMSLRAMAAFAPEEFMAAAASAFEKLGEISAPVLIIVGSLDGMTGVKAGHLIAERLPSARVVELDGSGHYPWVDVPEQFRDAVVSFLAEAPPAAQQS